MNWQRPTSQGSGTPRGKAEPFFLLETFACISTSFCLKWNQEICLHDDLLWVLGTDILKRITFELKILQDAEWFWKGACERLCKALFLHPYQLELLLVKGEVQLDTRPATATVPSGMHNHTWRALFAELKTLGRKAGNADKGGAFLGPDIVTDTRPFKGYGQCEGAYAERFHLLFKSDQVQQWVFECMAKLVNMFNGSLKK